MCFYIWDEGGRGGYKEGTERKQERERGAAQRDSGEGAVKRNDGGRREREAVDRGRAESGRASERKTKIRDEERGEEREDNPLFFLGL